MVARMRTLDFTDKYVGLNNLEMLHTLRPLLD